MEGAVVRTESALSDAELEAQIIELASRLNAASYRWLALIAELDRRQAWAAWYSKSCAHWLNYACGLDLGAAREWVRVARALEGLPKISAAMARGELSYSKVRAMSRVACPATEEYFLSIALHGTAHHVEAVVRSYRRATEAAELSREARQQAARRVSYFWEEDGSRVVKARLPAEAGAIVLEALAAAAEHVSAETSAPNSAPSMRRADALALLAESFLASGAVAQSGGDRQQIVVHVDAETLRNSEPGRCEIEHGPSVAAETARRLACESSVVTLLEDAAGEPLNVGRRTRSIPPAMRRALQARDRGCRFPGCTHQRYVDGHHVRHWAAGGETKLSNLVLLCRTHHRAVHEGGVRIEARDDGALGFIVPGGRTVISQSPPSSIGRGGERTFPRKRHDTSALPGEFLRHAPIRFSKRDPFLHD
jgi:hypothetical protein